MAAYTAMDPEGEDVTWSLSETVSDTPDHGDFTIEGGRAHASRSPPNFEGPKGGESEGEDIHLQK